MTRRFGTAVLLAGGLAVGAPVALGDIDPVRLTITSPASVTAGKRASIRVTVDADAGAFNSSSAPIRVRAKLARACGADFEGTSGRVAIDKPLNPQPTTDVAFHAVAKGRPKLTRRTTYALCVFVTDGEDRQFASDVDTTIKVRKKARKH